MILSLGDVTSNATTIAGGRMDFTLSEASFWANLALEQIVEAAGTNHIPREAIATSSTTSGGRRVALPSDFGWPRALTLFRGSSSTQTSTGTTVVELLQKDPEWVDRQQDYFTAGVPEAYAWTATWIELHPSPDSAYSLQLRYSALQETLTASTATPANILPRWHQAWLYKTAELMCMARSDREGEAVARNRYLNYVSTLRSDIGERQQDKRSMTVYFRGGRRSW